MLTRTRKAFTLLELIVVIVILGILALIAIPTFASVINKSHVATANETAGSVSRDAAALAAFDQKGWGDTDANSTASSPNNTYLAEAAAEVGSGTVAVVASGPTVTGTGSSATAKATLTITNGGTFTCTLSGSDVSGSTPTVSCVAS